MAKVPMEVDLTNDEDEKEDVVPEEVLSGFKTIDEFSKAGLSTVSMATRAFQVLPKPGPDWDIQKSYPQFNKSVRGFKARTTNLITKILNVAKIPTNDFMRRELDDQFDFIVESNDDILERIGTSLDEAEGLFKRAEALPVNPSMSTASSSKRNKKRKNITEEDDEVMVVGDVPASSEVKLTKKIEKNTNSISARQIRRAVYKLKNTDKPQLRFKVPVDNSTAPFVPKLKDKPHSIKPLSILPEYTSKNEEFYGHPYEIEINKWEPKDWMLKKVKPEKPRLPQQTPLNFIHSPAALAKLLSDLRDQTEIAIDLEHHSFRTYQGITCLMQISTREKDYIVDGFSLREDLHVLNEIFANPKVVKVFHGAQSDVEWLQKDFGLYVVGLFDTYNAAKTLGFQQLSLQHLLSFFCGVKLDKIYQLADWRIRPLTKEMIEYARMDTHYLLFIYDILKNQLIDSGNEFNNLLCSVYDQCKATCLKRYEKPAANPQLALRKTKKALNNRQLYAFTEIYLWRDKLAREKDESLGFILPNHMLLTIAQSLPKEMTGILACCDPVPFYMQTHIGEIHKIVQRGRDLPLHDEQKSLEVHRSEKRKTKNWMVILNSVHDVNPEELDLEEGRGTNNSPGSVSNTQSSEDSQNLRGEPSSWPKPWVNSTGSKIRVKARPTCAFSSRKTKPTPSNKDPITPYSRYKISMKVVDALKDPERRSKLDMEDSIVKTVLETIFTGELKGFPGSGDGKEAPKRQLDVGTHSATLPGSSKSHESLPEDGEIQDVDEEYIPFNLLAIHKGGKRSERNKKRKAETLNDSQSSQPPKGHSNETQAPNNSFEKRMRSSNDDQAPGENRNNKNSRKNRKKNRNKNHNHQQQHQRKGWSYQNPVPDQKSAPPHVKREPPSPRVKQEPHSQGPRVKQEPSSPSNKLPNPKYKGDKKVFGKFKGGSSNKSISFK